MTKGKKSIISLSDIKKNYSNIHFGLLFLMIAFCIFGAIMVLSSSSVTAVSRWSKTSNYYFNKQLFFYFLGFTAGLLAVIHIPTKFYEKNKLVLLLLITAALVLIRLYGATGGGAQSWFKVKDFGIQPSEFAKVILILYLAGAYHYTSKIKNLNVAKFLKPLIPPIGIIVLVILQPDMGGAALMIAIMGLIFIAIPYGNKYKKPIYLAAIILALIGGIFILTFKDVLLRSYQSSRLNFLHPCQRYSDEKSTGYQVCNAYIAIKNGGLTGVGLGESTQKYLYLPEAHTDFIFPIVIEECGLIGGLIVLFFYLLLLLVILDIAKKASNLRNSLIAYGVFAYITIHLVVNLFGVLGLMPLTGVPLPFISYGGSYNISLIISLFLVQRVHIENKQDKVKYKIKNL